MTENPARQAPAEPIAIVGMACRFPDATGPAEFLELVLAGRRAFRRMPPVRLDVSEYGDGEPGPSGLGLGAFGPPTASPWPRTGRRTRRTGWPWRRPRGPSPTAVSPAARA
jgi:hypothetical protein